MRKNQLCFVIQHTLFSCLTESFSTICKTHENKAYSTPYLTEEQNCLENRYFCRVMWVCAEWAAWRTLQSSQRTPLYPELHHWHHKAAGPELVKLLRFMDTEVIRICPRALLRVWVDGECFPQAEVNVWNLLAWEDTEANYLSTFKKDRHIKEEPEDQRRPWESRKVANKCKVSFVRESGYFLCSGTGLTDQNKSSLVQYYALAVDSMSFRKKLLHHSCLATYHSTLQLHGVHWLVSFSQDALLPTEPVRKCCLVSSPVALKLCYSLSSNPTQISDLPLPFLLKHHPPTATRAPPHRAEEKQRSSQRGCNSWEKGSQHSGTSQRSATSSLYPDEYQ